MAEQLVQRVPERNGVAVLDPFSGYCTGFLTVSEKVELGVQDGGCISRTPFRSEQVR
jgi:hypothetical protein